MLIDTHIKALEVIKHLSNKTILALDTETTGLLWRDLPFSVIIADDTKEYYFDFNGKLTDWTIFRPLFDNEAITFFMHNAVFDRLMLEKKGLTFKAKIMCTMVMARIIKNDLANYGLAHLSKLIGSYKDDKVKEYLNKNKLYTVKTTLGKKTKEKIYHYNKIPLDLIVPYACQDARAAYTLGMHELVKLGTFKTLDTLPPITKLVDNEIALGGVLKKMEATGIKIDVNFCRRALEYEKIQYQNLEQDFQDLTGLEFNDGRKTLVAAFNRLDLRFPLTDKGNPCFNEDALESLDSPLAEIIKKYRHHYKRVGTYFQSFLELKDSNDIIHCNFKQSGTTTGRMSCKNPNLQNIPKSKEDKDTKFNIRKCFIPREGFCFFMLDYDQMEYRLMLDYAEEMPVIERVLDGMDVHTATAELMGVERFKAKTINFMLLYGGGAQKLATALKISYEEALDLKLLYFSRLPNVKRFIDAVIYKVKSRGHIFNWIGRKYNIGFNDAYKGPNYLIQGGCADIVKCAMVDIDKLLTGFKSRMVLQVHDEIVFEIYRTEFSLVPKIKKIMESAYKYKFLPLTVGVEYSKKSWYDKKPWHLNQRQFLEKK